MERRQKGSEGFTLAGHVISDPRSKPLYTIFGAFKALGEGARLSAGAPRSAPGMRWWQTGKLSLLTSSHSVNLHEYPSSPISSAGSAGLNSKQSFCMSVGWLNCLSAWESRGRSLTSAARHSPAHHSLPAVIETPWFCGPASTSLLPEDKVLLSQRMPFQCQTLMTSSQAP